MTDRERSAARGVLTRRRLLAAGLGGAGGFAAGAMAAPAPALADQSFPGVSTFSGNVQIQGSAPPKSLQFPGAGGTLYLQGPHPWADVRAFGAVGDGQADDIQAIAHASAALGTTGGTIFFPLGLYKISRAWTPPPNVLILGETRFLSGPVAGGLTSSILIAPNPDAFAWKRVNGVSAAIDLSGGNTTVHGMVIESDLDARVSDPPDRMGAVVLGAPFLRETIIRAVRPTSSASPIWGMVDTGGSSAENASIFSCSGGLFVKGAGQTCWSTSYVGNSSGSDGEGRSNLWVDSTPPGSQAVFSDCAFDETFSGSPSVGLSSRTRGVAFVGCLAFSSGAHSAYAVEDHGRGNKFIGCWLQAWDQNIGKPLGILDGADPKFVSCHISSRETRDGLKPVPFWHMEKGSTASFLDCSFGWGTFDNTGPGTAIMVEDAANRARQGMEVTVQLGNIQSPGDTVFGVFAPSVGGWVKGYRLASFSKIPASDLAYWSVQLEHYRDGVFLGAVGAKTSRLSDGSSVKPGMAWGADEDRRIEQGDSIFARFTRSGSPAPFTSTNLALFFESD